MNRAPDDDREILLADIVYRDGLNRKYLRPEDLRRLSHAEFSSRRAIEGLYSGKHHTVQRGQSVEFHDYRQYIPGDSLNHLDWKVLGRTDKLFIKLYEHHADLTAHLLVDASHSMVFNGFDRQGDTKYDASCRLAAAIGFLITKQHDRFSFSVAQDGLQQFARPARTTSYLMDVLDKMERVVPLGQAGLGQAIEQLLLLSKRRDLVCIFTDLLDNTESLFRQLSVWLERGGEAIVFHVLHPDELELPDAGMATLIDSENRQIVRADISSLRQDYQNRFAEYLKQCSRRCTNLGIDYNLVRVNDPYPRALERYFARRRNRLAAGGTSKAR